MVLKANDAFERVTGYTGTQLHDEATGLCALLSDPQGYETALSNLTAGKPIHELELSLCRRDGHFIDCLISVQAITIAEQPCMLTIIQDITASKRSEADLMAAIQAALQDTTWLSQTVLEKLAQIRQPVIETHPGAELADLTPREREILGMMCQDMTDSEIARALNVSPHTVRNHVASLYSKLGVHRR